MDLKVMDTIREYGMLQQGGGVVVGVSGGADSVALLDFLCRLRGEQRLRLRIVACHINHSLRGEESDRDERFVRALCDGLKVRCACFTEDIAGLASRAGKSVEEAARERRYELFGQVRERLRCSRVATAHTLSDSMETALFHFARGSALRGLCGIPPVRGEVIRPLIGVTRGEVEAYCARRGLEYVTDSTNLSDDYARNRIRHRVVPGMASVNPAAQEAFARLSESLRLTQDYLEEQARALLRESRAEGGESAMDARRLAGAHPALLRAALALLLGEAGAEVSFAKVKRLEKALLAGRDNPRGKTAEEFVSGRRWRVEGGLLVLEGSLSAKAARGACPVNGEQVLPVRSLPLSGELVAQFDSREIQLLYREYEHYKENENNIPTYLKNVADYDKIKDTMVVRSRREGDRFSLPGRGWTKPLKKLMHEYGVPPEERDHLAVCADGTGVIWVEGFGVHARAAAGASTKRALVFRVTAGLRE